MLSQFASADKLKRLLVARDKWHPYPTASERKPWSAVPRGVTDRLIAHARALRDQPWPALPATRYLDYVREGNRSRYERLCFERRTRLSQLVLAECLEGKGAFLDAIADGVWATCEESSWSIPAHLWPQRAGYGLPDTAEPIVDLFVGETAALLAWTAYLLEQPLATVSPLIVPRIRREVQSRFLTPCLRRRDFWWMGFRGQHVNNWNPWVNSNWLTAALLIEEDPARRAAAVAKILRSVDRFVESYPADGGCDEGPSYWGRAGASLFDCLELLHSATGGRIDFYGEPLVREIGRFIYRAHLAEDWFVNFADAPALLTPSAALVFRYGMRIEDPMMQSFGIALLRRHTAQESTPREISRALRSLFALREMLAKPPAKPPLPRDVWLPDTQVMLARSRAGSVGGLTLAAKGGHNAESHNHNDVGHFIVFADGHPVIVDAGVETYTRKTFSAERYSIWTMQSQYHSLPTVNGVMQSNGRQFRAGNVSYRADDRAAIFSLDIAGAYPPAAGLKTWQRTLALQRHGEVLIEEHYALARTPKGMALHLLTPCRPIVRHGLITLAPRALPGGRKSGAARLVYQADRLAATVETIALEDANMQRIWGDRLFRIVLRAGAPEKTGQFALLIEQI